MKLHDIKFHENEFRAARIFHSGLIGGRTDMAKINDVQIELFLLNASNGMLRNLKVLKHSLHRRAVSDSMYYHLGR